MSEAPKDDGGPAYPFVSEILGHWCGMSFRDVAAINAMKAMCGGTWPDSNDRREIAKRAWAMADEMQKARNQ
jgi:hypothetical protein